VATVKKIETTPDAGVFTPALLHPQKRQNEVEAQGGSGALLAVVLGRFLVVVSSEK